MNQGRGKSQQIIAMENHEGAKVEPFLEFGGNGVLLAVVLAAFKALEARAAKKNGGTVYTRCEALTREIESLQEKLSSFHRDFMVHREHMRIFFAKAEAKAEAKQEIRRELNEQ